MRKKASAATKSNTMDRIISCMLMEAICSDVYHLLALNFAEENALWNELAIAEETHAEIIAAGIKIREREAYSDFSLPEDLAVVRKTIDYGEEIKKKLAENEIPLKEALELTLALNRLKNKSYFSDLIGKETEERIKRVFKKLITLDTANLEIIKAVMIKRGFKNKTSG